MYGRRGGLSHLYQDETDDQEGDAPAAPGMLPAHPGEIEQPPPPPPPVQAKQPPPLEPAQTADTPAPTADDKDSGKDKEHENKSH